MPSKSRKSSTDIDDEECDLGELCEVNHVRNPATCRCIPRDTALGKIILRNSHKTAIDIPDESSFPAYADQLIRDQVSAVSAKLQVNNDTLSKLSERVESLATHLLGSKTKLDEIDVLRSRIEDHEEKVNSSMDMKKSFLAMNLNVKTMESDFKRAMELVHENAESNAQLKDMFATLSGVSEKLETMRSEFFQHAARVEEVSKSNKALEGIESRVKDDIRLMSQLRESMAETSAASKDTLHAARVIKDEAEALKSEVGHTFLLVEDTRKTLQMTLEESRESHAEIKSYHEKLTEEMARVNYSIVELEKKALNSVEAKLHEVEQAFVSAEQEAESHIKKAMNTLEEKEHQVVQVFLSAEQEAEAHVKKSAEVASEIVEKDAMRAENAAKSVIEAANLTMEKMEKVEEKLKAEEHEAEQAVQNAEAIIEKELERVQADVVGMENAASATVEQIEGRVTEVERQLADEATNIQNTLGVATDVMETQHTEGHHHSEIPEHMHAQFAPGPTPTMEADDPERTMVIERAQEEARSLHQQVSDTQNTLKHEEQVLHDEQSKADADYAVAQDIRKQANEMERELEKEMRQISQLSGQLNQEETNAVKHPENQQIVESMEETQAEIQQLENNVEIIKERTDELEQQYNEAAQALEVETAHLQSDADQYHSDKQAALVYAQEGEQADALLREASEAYRGVSPNSHVPVVPFAEEHVSHVPVVPFAEEHVSHVPVVPFVEPPQHAREQEMYEHAAHQAAAMQANNRPMTAAEKYLGHYLPQNYADPYYERPPPLYRFAGGSKSLSEAQKREAESYAMKSLLARGIKPATEGYKKIMSFVRSEAENAHKVVQVTNELIEKVLI